MFEVVFDYDEGHYEETRPESRLLEDEQHRMSVHRHHRAGPIPGPCGPTRFSSHRAGFEVRTYRRCHRILMFHRFTELGGRALPGALHRARLRRPRLFAAPSQSRRSSLTRAALDSPPSSDPSRSLVSCVTTARRCRSAMASVRHLSQEIAAAARV